MIEIANGCARALMIDKLHRGVISSQESSRSRFLVAHNDASINPSWSSLSLSENPNAQYASMNVECKTSLIVYLSSKVLARFSEFRSFQR